MSHPRIYQPELHPHLVKGLHHEARHRKVPMTKLLNGIVAKALEHTEGMRIASEEIRQSAGEQVAA